MSFGADVSQTEPPTYAGCIAVFDSGVGGLTVVRAIREVLPDEDIVYFGDTARVPYGTKSSSTIERFALEDARFLLRFSPRIIVVACNTASAVAVERLRAEMPVPVVGVVEPGARTAARATANRAVAVIGTETTIGTDAYARALAAIDPDIQVFSKACPLLVPIVEEGRANDDLIARQAAAEYLEPLKQTPADTLILGCTHYPLLADAIADTMGPAVRIVDASRETAREVARLVGRPGDSGRTGRCYFLASDNPARFAAIGSRFMGARVQKVFYVTPDDFAGSPPGTEQKGKPSH